MKWLLVIGRLQNRCGDTFLFYFFGNLFIFWVGGYMYTQLLVPDQTSQTRSMVAKRALTNQTFKPLFENTRWQNATRSRSFGYNWASYYSQKEENLKWQRADLRRRAQRPGTRNQEPGTGEVFFLSLMIYDACRQCVECGSLPINVFLCILHHPTKWL